MGVSLYKDGTWQVFDEYAFEDRLEEGWSFTEEGPVVVVCNLLPKNNSHPGYGIGSGPDAAEWKLYDTPKQPVMSSKQVRAAAKKAGIKGHKKARIQTLLKALAK